MDDRCVCISTGGGVGGGAERGSVDYVCELCEVHTTSREQAYQLMLMPELLASLLPPLLGRS